MRKSALAAVAGLAMCAGAAHADVYVDNVFDTFTGAGGGILDIVSVEVTNDLTNIQFKISVLGDVVATDWGKYMIAIDSAAGGDTSSNGWARPISMPSGMDSWLGGWVDSGNGLENRAFGNSPAWSLSAATYGPNSGTLSISKSVNEITITASLASLGIAPGSTIFFDVFTSGGGGGDGAVDSLQNPGQSIADWGNSYAATGVSYFVVPTPGAVALVGVAGLMAGRRRR